MHRSETLTSLLRIPAITRTHLLIAGGTIGVALLPALAANLRVPIPFSPVPVTMQTMVVLLGAATLGGTAGPLSQLLFIGLGTAGVTAFAGGALSGVTGGYLIGFVRAARIVGVVSDRYRNPLHVGLAMAAGSALLLLLGAVWLHLGLGLSTGEALTAGVLPFLPGDALMAVAAVAIGRAGIGGWRRISGDATK